MSPGVVNRRYRRHCEFFNASGTVTLMVMTLLGIAVSIGGYIFLYTYTEGNAAMSTGGSPWVTASIFTGPITGVYALICWAVRLVQKWNACYAEVYVFEAADKLQPWKTTGLLKTFLPRLAFVDVQKGDFFSGPTKESGARTGSIHLALPEGERIVNLSGQRELYDLQPSRSQFTEVPARETYDILEMAVAIGQLKARIGKSKLAKMLSENGAWLVTAGNAVFIFFMVSAK